MPGTIQLRDVPDDLHVELQARALEEGLSLSDYIINSIKRPVTRSSNEELMRKLSGLRPLELAETPEQTIRAMRDGR